jgi:hypothetical protein
MPPPSALSYITNSSGSNTVDFRKCNTFEKATPNFKNLFLRELTFKSARNSVIAIKDSVSVKLIVGRSTPLQILDSIVSLYAVFVVNKWKSFWIWKVFKRYKTMNQKVGSYSFVRKKNVKVAVLSKSWFTKFKYVPIHGLYIATAYSNINFNYGR